MALDMQDRLALQEGLVDGLGRDTADRLMTALPDIDFEERFDRIDEQFRLVHHEFKLVHDEFKLVHGEIKFVNDQFKHVNERFNGVEHRFNGMDRQFEYVQQRFNDLDPVIDSKVAAHVRSFWLAIVGMVLAHAAVVAAAVGITVSAISN